MAYTKRDWKRRYSERSDLSTSLVHLTKRTKRLSSVKIMHKILKEKKLVGSTTDSGFIVGSNRAVCFQDAPVHAICQNCWFEQKLRESDDTVKVRYQPSGFLFHKQLVFKSGGRPAIYDRTSDAKQYLPESEWWRIVNLNLNNDSQFVDWTHEREWRVKNEFNFELSDVTLLFATGSTYKSFIKYCDELNTPFYKEVAGVIVTEEVFF
ncbi:TPA: hypothetical protein N2941_004407 [Vibrio parahaemolyticus]|nr:hypothetical protein [Vibrio parahaemolyticus]